jgi:NAD(P)-dependent dehydrogenase (short-subunit alcohol dehydrogenase family)
MIDGKVIAITGASSGIGEATALHLARHGAKVVLGADDLGMGNDEWKRYCSRSRVRHH